jgi:hypothetical protein
MLPTMLRVRDTMCPHCPILKLLAFLTLRATKRIEGSSTTCVASQYPLINFLSLRLRAVLRDPRDQQLTGPVIMRREKMVAIELVLHSASQSSTPWGWQGIQLPQSYSVKPTQRPPSGKLLKLSIQVIGCTTGDPDVRPCNMCWARERHGRVGTPDLQPYMIDFKAESDIVALSEPSYTDDKCLKAIVKFRFTCYSRHNGGIYG